MRETLGGPAKPGRSPIGPRALLFPPGREAGMRWGEPHGTNAPTVIGTNRGPGPQKKRPSAHTGPLWAPGWWGPAAVNPGKARHRTAKGGTRGGRRIAAAGWQAEHRPRARNGGPGCPRPSSTAHPQGPAVMTMPPCERPCGAEAATGGNAGKAVGAAAARSRATNWPGPRIQNGRRYLRRSGGGVWPQRAARGPGTVPHAAARPNADGAAAAASAVCSSGSAEGLRAHLKVVYTLCGGRCKAERQGPYRPRSGLAGQQGHRRARAPGPVPRKGPRGPMDGGGPDGPWGGPACGGGEAPFFGRRLPWPFT